MKKIYLLTGLVAGILFFSACNDKLDLVDPTRVTSETYFTNGSELQKGVNSIYAAIQGFQLYGNQHMWLYEFLGDDGASGGAQLEPVKAAILNGSYTADNVQISDPWSGWYVVIHRANTVIERAPGIDAAQITTALRDTCVAEAKFLRAFAYFGLVVVWGDVPIYTKPITTTDDYLPRSPVADVYTQIIKDLKDAQAVLPAVREFEGGRATKYAAQALLGKVYMQLGEYQKAKEQFELVKAGPFKINLPYNDNFLIEVRTNDESIFQVNNLDMKGAGANWNAFGDGDPGEECLRSTYVRGNGWRNMIPSNSFLAEFEHVAKGDAKTDPRLKYTVFFTGDSIYGNTAILTDAMQSGATSVFNGATVKASWRKLTTTYKGNIYGSAISQRIIRYADILLLLAECENELGNISAAIDYLNMVRKRPGVDMPIYPIVGKYPCSNKDEVFKAIMHERRVELGFEEVRPVDLLRWKRLGKITAWPYSYTPKNTNGYLPVPQVELQTNTKIGNQNQTSGF